jgi:hypothetical protein
MKRILVAAFVLLWANAALAQSWTAPGPPSGTGYPVGSQPVTSSATGTTGAVVATLPAAVAKTTYICGFTYQGSDATAAQNGVIVVSGTISGSLNYAYPTRARRDRPTAEHDWRYYTPCIPASAVNTAIVVTSPALGAGATVASVAAWGYQF